MTAREIKYRIQLKRDAKRCRLSKAVKAAREYLRDNPLDQALRRPGNSKGLAGLPDKALWHAEKVWEVSAVHGPVTRLQLLRELFGFSGTYTSLRHGMYYLRKKEYFIATAEEAQEGARKAAAKEALKAGRKEAREEARRSDAEAASRGTTPVRLSDLPEVGRQVAAAFWNAAPDLSTAANLKRLRKRFELTGTNRSLTQALHYLRKQGYQFNYH